MESYYGDWYKLAIIFLFSVKAFSKIYKWNAFSKAIKFVLMFEQVARAKANSYNKEVNFFVQKSFSRAKMNSNKLECSEINQKAFFSNRIILLFFFNLKSL